MKVIRLSTTTHFACSEALAHLRRIQRPAVEEELRNGSVRGPVVSLKAVDELADQLRTCGGIPVRAGNVEEQAYLQIR